jgi:hypothetical protein
MLMHFHYGLGVGHIYSHHHVSLTGSQQTCNPSAGHILSDDGEASIQAIEHLEDEDDEDGDEDNGDEDDGDEDDQMV